MAKVFALCEGATQPLFFTRVLVGVAECLFLCYSYAKLISLPTVRSFTNYLFEYIRNLGMRMRCVNCNIGNVMRNTNIY